MTVLSRWLLLGEWRAHPVRALVAVAAIAVGVAMGFAIHLINAAAFRWRWRRSEDRATPSFLARTSAALSLALWLAVGTLGRLIAYT